MNVQCYLWNEMYTQQQTQSWPEERQHSSSGILFAYKDFKVNRWEVLFQDQSKSVM